MTENLFVLTGGPGSGKSTLVSALARGGFRTVEEAGRAIIREQVAVGGHALPWDDSRAFADEMLARDFLAYARYARSHAPVFFDRGIPDVIGYLQLCGLEVPERAWQAARDNRYADTVLIAPFWADIYAQDAERHQSPEEAARTCAVMRDVYSALGYRLVDLPRADVETRVRFVLEAIR